MPLAVKRILARGAGAGATCPPPRWCRAGWSNRWRGPTRQVWVWGAGHVGRALVAVLAPLPGLAITWVDVAADRFPADVPASVTVLPAADPARAGGPCARATPSI